MLLALGALAIAAGCNSQPAAAIRIAGEEGTHIGTAFSFVAHGQPLSFGAITVCLTQPAVATITAVSLREPTGGLEVDDFAVRPVPSDGNLLGNVFVPLRATGFAAASRATMRGSCAADGSVPRDSVAAADPAGDVFEMAIQVSWSSGAAATASGIEIAYTVDGSSGSSTIPWAVGVCADKCPDGLLR